MLRQALRRLDKVVVVESPNKVASLTKYIGEIQRENKGDLSFGVAKLAKLCKTPNERIVVLPTYGHFMAIHGVDIKRSTRVSQASKVTSADDDVQENGKAATHAIAPLQFYAKWGPENQRSGKSAVDIIVGTLGSIKNVSEVILATDPDREGELISAHVLKLLKGHAYSRAYIRAITKDGVMAALRERQAMFLNHSLASAAETRHIMDRMFGFLGSRYVVLLNDQLRSVGRVQTPSLILLQERQDRIRKIVEQGKVHFSVVLTIEFASGAILSTRLLRNEPSTAQDQDQEQVDGQSKPSSKGKKSGETAASFASKEEAEKFAEQVGIAAGTTASSFELVDTSGEQKYAILSRSSAAPPPPLTMQTLILEAGKRFKLSSEAVADGAQHLFQSGLITYPRTDSERIDMATVDAKIAPYIKTTFGADKFFVPGEPSAKRGKKKKSDTMAKVDNVEDAHEAIHPTNMNVTPAKIAATGVHEGHRLNVPIQKLYGLIHSATAAAFMIPYVTETAAVQLALKSSAGNEQKLRTMLRARRVVEKGWHLAFEAQGSADPQDLDAISDADDSEATVEGNELFEELCAYSPERLQKSEPSPFTVQAVAVKERKASVPQMFTEGTLIQELKKNGVGRPSTYPTIVKTLAARAYITVNNSTQKISLTDSGIALVQISMLCFPQVVDIKFTSTFEKHLDKIARKKAVPHEILTEFWHDLVDMITDFTMRQSKNNFLAGTFAEATKHCNSIEHGCNMLRFYLERCAVRTNCLRGSALIDAAKASTKQQPQPAQGRPNGPFSPTPTALQAGTGTILTTKPKDGVEEHKKPKDGVEEHKKPKDGVEEHKKPKDGVEEHKKPKDGVEEHKKPKDGVEEHKKPKDGVEEHKKPKDGVEEHRKPKDGVEEHKKPKDGVEEHKKPKDGVEEHKKPKDGVSSL